MTKHKGHSLTRKICHWWFCVKCGLVALNNEPTRRALAASCKGDDE